MKLLPLDGCEEDDADDEVGFEEVQIDLQNYGRNSNAGEEFKRIDQKLLSENSVNDIDNTSKNLRSVNS